MAPNVSVPPFDEAPVTVVGSTPQDTFAFDFPFWDEADVLVYVDGAALDSSSYTVEGFALQDAEPVEGGYGSGQVVLDTAVSNCTVTIDRFVVGERNSQFSKSSPLGMPALNSDLNRVTARQQDLARLFRATDSGSAGASADRADQAADRAETAAGDSAGAQEASEEARDEAVIAKDQAEAFRDETAAYAGTTNVSGFYTSTALGLAGTPNQGFFGVPGTNGVAIYLDNAGVAVAGPVIPSIDYVSRRPQFIKCIASSVTSGNSYTITPVDTAIRYSGTAEQYVWVWQAPAANNVSSGSVDVTIKDGAGTTFATITLRKRGNAVLNGTEFQPGDLIFARRQTAAETPGQQLLWMAPPDASTVNLPPVIRAVHDAFGFNPSTDRPLFYFKTGPNQHYISMRLTEGAYETGVSRRHSDGLRVVEHDMATFQSDTGNVCSLNSYFTRIGGTISHDLNMMFERLIGGATVDTGRVPTILEVPFQGGKFGDPVNLYVVAGPGHGYMVDPVTTYTGTLNDFTTSYLDVTTSIDPDADYGNSYFGNKLVKVLSAKLENAAHDVFCFATWTITYDPDNTTDGQIRVQTKYDFTHASVTVTPGFLRTSAMLFAGSDLDLCRPIVDGVRGAITTIDNRDGNDTYLTGHPQQVIFWHSAQDDKKWYVKSAFPHGYSHKENGVLIPQIANNSYVDNFDWGVKMYANPVGDQTATTPRDMTGIVMEFDTWFQLRVETPEA